MNLFVVPPPIAPKSPEVYKRRYMNHQNTSRLIPTLILLLAFSNPTPADDPQALVKKAVERSTLNQPGTHPFHLKAALAPTLERDRSSNRTGEVEIWWASPTQWKREVRSPEFLQVAIVNAGREWQKNEGDYFPEWLRETSVALIEPVPNLDKVLEKVKESDVKKMFGSTYISWSEMSSDGTVSKGIGAQLAINDATGLLQDAGGPGWDGLFKDYKNFHGRMVARNVTVGTPEITATITQLDDLGNVPSGFFEPAASEGDPALLHTIVLDEIELRKNLLHMEPIVWPALKDGPLEGAVSVEIVVDRTGKVRDVGVIVSDNPGLSETAGKSVGALQFKPYLENGVPVQVISCITMPFKTVRPAGVESFESARTYFERGRHASFPAAGNGQPYVLQATFQTRVAAGTVQDGQYTDTWKSDQEWRREATIGKSRCIRSRHGDTRYQWFEGPDGAMLRLVLRLMEPIPTMDTFIESDWRINRETLDGVNTIRVLAGYESPDGVLDPQQARAYWFDENGRLLKTYFIGIETRRLSFADVDGAQLAREIRVYQKTALAMLIRVTDITAPGPLPDNTFEVPGHKWNRSFTDEER